MKLLEITDPKEAQRIVSEIWEGKNTERVTYFELNHLVALCLDNAFDTGYLKEIQKKQEKKDEQEG